jgi:hypothetical protein
MRVICNPEFLDIRKNSISFFFLVFTSYEGLFLKKLDNIDGYLVLFKQKQLKHRFT